MTQSKTKIMLCIALSLILVASIVGVVCLSVPHASAATLKDSYSIVERGTASSVTFTTNPLTASIMANRDYTCLFSVNKQAVMTTGSTDSIDQNMITVTGPASLGLMSVNANITQSNTYLCYRRAGDSNFTAVHSNASLTGSTYTLDTVKLPVWTNGYYEVVSYLNYNGTYYRSPILYIKVISAPTVSTPTKTGYTFNGWYTDEDCTVPFDGVVTGNATVYAGFTPNNYSIKFNGNGNTGGTMPNLSMTYDTAKALTSNAFSRTGYTFQGWSTTSGGTATYTNGQSVSNLTATANGTVNLYAVWQANSYSIKFNGNGNTGGTMSNLSMTYDASKNLTANAFTRTGYEFLGWATSASGEVEYTNSESVKNLTATANGTVNLYAVWKELDYTVKFNNNGGSGTMADQKHQRDIALALTSNTFTKTGYTFKGWATSANGTVAYTNGQSVTNIGTADSTVTLYAVWQANSYTIKFNGNGSDGGTMSNLSMTYDTAKNLTANGFTKTGYHFIGWATSATGGVVYTDAQSVSNLAQSGNVTLYAVWEVNVYTITFIVDGEVYAIVEADYGTAVSDIVEAVADPVLYQVEGELPNA